ncbi:hypothetical protein QSJ18_01910 [Gordonia sp. ABSL1-1]|uniref:hypothetical protein n=1 Tax=Gordonia sp. ABSL1-1 TaxID=3053923 RepID=UPI0025737991|nr:hypothetical protein [Gordonia sp. ABSL1-1]MDL9935492.1 hypothetical protein [Gordonia sp. ABSL1-1]
MAATYIWGRPRPTTDRCRGAHTYAGGCRYNSEDPHRPIFPEEIRPGNRSRTTQTRAA